MIYFGIVIIIIVTSVGFFSYISTKNTVEKRVTQSTVETLKQLDRNMYTVFGGVDDLSLFIISDKNIKKLTNTEVGQFPQIGELIAQLDETYANLTNTKSYILAVNVYSDKGLKFESAGISHAEKEPQLKERESQIPADGKNLLTYTYRRKYQQIGDKYVLSLYRQLNDINNLTKRLGIIRIDLSEREINRIYRDIQLGETGYVFITNKDGVILSHSNVEMINKNIRNEELFKKVFTGENGFYREKYSGQDMLVTYYESNIQDMTYISVVPFKEITRELNTSLKVTLSIVAVVIALAFIALSFLTMKITKPIKKMTVLMKKVEQGNLDVLINTDRKDEIGTLGRSFNSMTRKLKILIEEVYKIQLSRKEAELKTLQAQINPHFLYNTLDVIYWTSRLENAPRTGEIVSALAKLFKLGLNKGSEITTIKKEVEHVQSYLTIQKYRYDEIPEFRIDVDESILEHSTIKLILQPFVENALVHGIAEMGGRGRVEILGRDQGKNICFEVIDNGKGMEEDRIREIFEENFESDQKGYGVRNVHKRIKLYFGQDYGVEIFSKTASGTKVVITIPKVIFKLDSGGHK
ncbi:integral membrane sensor signal transduction histidine kinase [Ruminiclostridium cellobioparum subsp. termitidis CT1112]|uniref:histidine kinase n=2 Tax=Ruminiclostridium cellobioparum TaxID=29355 RepID=S0FNQ0_RUMCE|nr:integral membrane sensor signal transduction histidine kinase [Ruminiclostridium cellobioparum subsp. termitidis CT1112]